MLPWMFVRELESLETEGIDAILDRLEAGGIRTVVLGDLWFKDGTPAFDPTPARYDGLRKRSAPLPPAASGRAQTVAAAIQRARRRGFGLYLHDWSHCGGGEGMNDPQSTAFAAARTRDS